MGDILDKINETLSKFENSTKAFDEFEIHSAIERLQDKNDTSRPPMEWLAEYIAFGFYEDSSGQGSVWGTYFGPLMSGTNKDGSGFEFPSLSHVTNEILNYWAKRAKEAKHPILKTRYTALVWEFSRKVTNQNPDIEMAHICIDSIIEMVALNCNKYEVELVQKMKYAIELAIRINDKVRLNRLRDSIISYEEKKSDDKRSWDASFDMLLMDEKVQLEEEQEIKIIEGLESWLEQVSNYGDKESFDPFDAESAAERLAHYYRAKNKPEEVHRVLLKYGRAFEQISASASGSLAIAWLQKVESVYRNFGLKDESDKLLNIIRQRGPDAQKDLKPISVKQEISREEMDNYVNAMLDGDINTVMSRIAVNHIPEKNKEIQTIKDLAQKNPLSYDMFTVIQDRNGRTIARIGPLEKDLDGHLVKHIAQGMHFSYIFLLNALHKFKEKFSISSDSIITELSKSPVFAQEKADILKKGLDAYFNGDHLVAIHLLIPQVEDSIRRLLELTGGTTYRPSRSGGYFLKTMDEMLRDDGIIKSLGEDANLYMRVLYTDPRGWNLRNDVCHGICMPEQFCQPIADRVFHTLLILGLIRERKEETQP